MSAAQWKPVHAPGLSLAIHRPPGSELGVAVWLHGSEWRGTRIGESGEAYSAGWTALGRDRAEARRMAVEVLL
jgi:hypothetical protein